VRAALAGLTGEWELLEHLMASYIEDGDRVAVLGQVHARNRRTGRDVWSALADFWRFRDGKAVSFFEFYDTAKIHPDAAAA